MFQNASSSQVGVRLLPEMSPLGPLGPHAAFPSFLSSPRPLRVFGAGTTGRLIAFCTFSSRNDVSAVGAEQGASPEQAGPRDRGALGTL